MAHKGWCGKTCADCENRCPLSKKIPCRLDCENLSPDGEADIVKCHQDGCDVRKLGYCSYCNTVVPLDVEEDKRVSIWNCRKCECGFCEDCFSSQHGADALHDMVCSDCEDDILCPDCYEEKWFNHDKQFLRMEGAVIMKTVEVGKIRRGEMFSVAGHEYVALEITEVGVLSIERASLTRMELGKTNDWRNSKIRDYLQTDYMASLVEKGFNPEMALPLVIDLKATDGSREYGYDSCKVGLLTLEQYTRYNEYIPLDECSWWLATPWGTPHTRSPHTLDSSLAWFVSTNGVSSVYYWTNSYGVRPALLFASTLLVSPIDENEDEDVKIPERIELDTMFGKVVAEKSGDPDHPGIHLVLEVKDSENSGTEERQLTLLEYAPDKQGDKSLRLMVWGSGSCDCTAEFVLASDDATKKALWEEYLLYLKKWADVHDAPEFYGMAPVPFNEWIYNENEEDEDDE